MRGGDGVRDCTEGGPRVTHGLSFTATVVMWDGQVKDGYKRSQTGESKTGESLPPVSWDGRKTSAVVEELLRNSSDKAYGATSETHTQSAHILSPETQLLTLHLCFSPQLGWGGVCC